MAGGRLVGIASLAAAGAIAAGSGPPQTVVVRQSPFGGSAAVHIAHVGRIEVDLGPARAQGLLERVRCFVPTPGTACFVARSRP